MSGANTRLADLISSGLPMMAETVEEELKSSDATRWASIAWLLVKSEMEERLEEALGADPLDLIALAWSKAQDLKKYTDPAKYPSDQSVVVHLGEHKVTWSLHPEIDIVLNEIPVRTVRFTLEFVAKFKTAALTIRGGAIRAIAPGSCSAQVVLKYGKVKLKEEETPEVHLPGRLDLGHGLPIGGPEETYP